MERSTGLVLDKVFVEALEYLRSLLLPPGGRLLYEELHSAGQIEQRSDPKLKRRSQPKRTEGR